MKRTLFEVHIEELTLHGFERLDRDAVAAAVCEELARLFAAGLPEGARGGAIDEVSGGAFTFTPGGEGAELGAQIANAVRRGVSER